jgi:uncharacterized membrane-anchored protein
MNRVAALILLVIVLGLVNWSIYKKEQQLALGDVVYLELVPVDPRSLMQGDYMALRFGVADQVYSELPKSQESRRWQHNVAATDGKIVVSLNDQSVATYKALYVGQNLQENELLMRYRVRNGTVKFATNAFFFQEGHASIYEGARYGQFRVDEKGELLLVAMHDEHLKKLQAE